MARRAGVMFGPRLFRSRRAALFWSAGILWTAYDIASAAPSAPAKAHGHPAALADATGEAVDPADLAAIANAEVR